MSNYNLTEKQTQDIMSSMEELYQSIVYFEASENLDYLDTMKHCHSKIQNFLNEINLKNANVQPEINLNLNTLSKTIIELIEKLKINSREYFDNSNQELLNAITDYLNQLEVLLDF